VNSAGGIVNLVDDTPFQTIQQQAADRFDIGFFFYFLPFDFYGSFVAR
jgi:hypothetical protein